MVAKGFPTVNITQMHLDSWNFDSGDRISNSNAGVRVGPWIDQQTMTHSQGCMDPIDQCAFMVFLETVQRNISQGMGKLF